MQRRRRSDAEFEHVAEHRDAPAACGPTAPAEHVSAPPPSTPDWRCSFRRSAAPRRLPTPSARRAPRPDRRLDLRQRQRRQREIGARQRGRRQHRQRVHRHMAAGHAEFVGDVMAEDVGVHAERSAMQRRRRSAARRISRPRRTNDPANAELSGPRQPGELRIVAVEHQRAVAGPGPRKISALASAIASMPAKNSRCTGSTVVMTSATCGRIISLSGSISPAWFMPISKIANDRSRAARQRQRHAPDDC